MKQYALALLGTALLLFAHVEAQQGSRAFPPGAKIPPKQTPLVAMAATTFALVARSAPSVNTDNGAYVGCFDVTKVPGISWTTQKAIKPITRCGKYCEDWSFAFSIIRPSDTCVCTNTIPSNDAKLDDAKCDNKVKNAAAVFYLHKNAGSRSCRIVRVPMQSDSFTWAYNLDKVSFQPPNQMSIRMDGNSGSRLYYPTALEYGLAQVDAKVSGVSGVISAFYLRSDTMQETSDFSEIDFEFLNARPGVTGALWTNSFKGGESFGEQMIPPSSYMKTLGTNCAVHECWYRFQIHWQPNQVSWYVNNRILRRNHFGQKFRWCDMNGKCTTKEFRPPVKPSFPTFSMWHDIDNNGAFGGTLGAGSPYSSLFRDLTLVACDLPLASYNGPAWTYGGKAPRPAPPPSPAPTGA